MHRDAEIARGERAQAILDDPLVVEAFAALERACIEEWRRAPARDVEGRERIWVMLKLCERLREHFASLVESGKLAADRVARIEKERRFSIFT
jgi:hypothetical protein